MLSIRPKKTAPHAIHVSRIPSSQPASCTCRFVKCGRCEGVQGVLTLFCIGAAQVCHDDRVVELKEQLEVEEEDGDRQEEDEEVESGEGESRRVRHG